MDCAVHTVRLRRPPHTSYTLHTPLKTKTFLNWKYYGEVNANGKEHGRGIRIWNHGNIGIGYFENDSWWTTGNYIIINSISGFFKVGEIYMKYGNTWRRGTEYKTNGIEENYDYKI